MAKETFLISVNLHKTQQRLLRLLVISNEVNGYITLNNVALNEEKNFEEFIQMGLIKRKGNQGAYELTWIGKIVAQEIRKRYPKSRI